MEVTWTCPDCNRNFSRAEQDPVQPVVCPVCQKQVPDPVARIAPLSTNRPLSLDDAVQLPPQKPRSRTRTGLIILVLVCVVVSIGTFIFARYGSGVVPQSAWQEFVPPDSYCIVSLPGQPQEESYPRNSASPITLDGKRFVVHRWFEQVTVEVGWLDLHPEQAKLTRAEDVIAIECERRATLLGGHSVKEFAIKLDQHIGREIQYELAKGICTERYIYVADGPKPRLYFVSVRGPRVKPEGPTTRTALDSFHLSR